MSRWQNLVPNRRTGRVSIWSGLNWLGVPSHLENWGNPSCFLCCDAEPMVLRKTKRGGLVPANEEVYNACPTSVIQKVRLTSFFGRLSIWCILFDVVFLKVVVFTRNCPNIISRRFFLAHIWQSGWRYIPNTFWIPLVLCMCGRHDLAPAEHLSMKSSQLLPLRSRP